MIPKNVRGEFESRVNGDGSDEARQRFSELQSGGKQQVSETTSPVMPPARKKMPRRANRINGTINLAFMGWLCVQSIKILLDSGVIEKFRE